INITIAFLGVATTLIKIASQFNPDIRPESPIEEMSATIGWILILFLVPIVLTPIIPVVWAMEDLRLKAWHKKKKVNWRVADKYRVKFNSFIAVGAVTAGLTLSQNPNLSFLDNAFLFVSLLGNGMILLTFPLSLLVAAYYLYFRGEITEKTLKRLDVPTAMTELIFDVEKYKTMSKKLEFYEKEEAKRLQREKRAKKMAERRSKVAGIFKNPFGRNKAISSPDSDVSDLPPSDDVIALENEGFSEAIEVEHDDSPVENNPPTKATSSKENKERKVVSALKAPPRVAKNFLGTLGSKGKSGLGKIRKPFRKESDPDENS
ncbi:MAG: sulfite exporter TauE/SafE family protein, partial [Methanobacteriota archaeon]